MKSWNKKSKNIIEIQKDRFIRFGYVCFKKICKKFNTTIVLVNMKNSYWLYGLRKYKKQIERDERIAEEL